jgi:hypothetical protein
LSFSIDTQFSTALLYGRVGRLTAKNGGFRPGQWHGGAAREGGHLQPGGDAVHRVAVHPLNLTVYPLNLTVYPLNLTVHPLQVTLIIECTVRGPAAWSRALGVSHSNSGCCGAFVWARGVLNSQERRFLARAVVRRLRVSVRRLPMFPELLHPLAERVAFPQSVKVTGLAQKLSQLEAMRPFIRIFNQNRGPTCD